MKTEAWLPHCPWSAKDGVIVDQSFRDFDAQAERLVGHDQEYMQLSPGPFHGRFVSCFLGEKVSLHIEHANQSLQQSVVGSDTAYSFGIALSAHSMFRANGVEIDPDGIFIVPPKAQLHLQSPQDATILAFVVETDFLENKLALAPSAQDWLRGISGSVVSYHAPNIVHRLRHDAYNAIQAAASPERADLSAAMLGDILINSFASALLLEGNGQMHPLSAQRSGTFSRFLEIKNTMRGSLETALSLADISRQLQLSERSIQYACTNESSLGYNSYLRLARLHAVRRSLCDGSNRSRSIGDIAAQHGFWHWSHFSAYYGKVFGERPSDTRSQYLIS